MKLLLQSIVAASLATPAFAAMPPPCPPAMGVVDRSVGATAIYLGAEPGNPELCRIKRGQDVALYYFGTWAKDWPGAEAARDALRTIYAGPPGAAVKFDVVAAPGLQWHETLRNDGPEDLRVLDRVWSTVKLVHERVGFGGNTYHSIITQWKDIETGMTVYQNYQHISGHPEPGGAWDPISISGGR